MLDSALRRLRIVRLRAGLALVRLGELLAGPLPLSPSRAGPDPDQVQRRFKEDMQAVVGKQGLDMLREGRPAPRRPPPEPTPPLRGSAADLIQRRNGRV